MDISEIAHQAMQPRMELLSEKERSRLAGMNLGERIRWVVDYLDEQYPGVFSPNRVAERTGVVSVTAIYDIIKGETKKPSVFAVKAIAKELGMDIDFLVSGEVRQKPLGNELGWLDRLPAEFITFASREESLPYVNAALKWTTKAIREGLPPDVLEAAMRGAVTALIEAHKKA